jgi:Xaa-Pro aminopeptidase
LKQPGQGDKMTISLEERDRRYSAIRELMKKDNLDSLLVAGRDGYMNRGNIRYITDYGVVTGEQYCIFRLEDVPVFLTGKGPVMARLHKAEWTLDFRVTSDTAAQAVQELSQLDHGNKVGIVGMQDIAVPLYLKVKEQFGNRLIDATGIFRQLRLVKSAEEINMMRKAASIADKVFEHLKEIVRPGLTGYEIYAEIKKNIFEMGCEYSFELISSEKTNVNLFHPTGDKLVANGILTLEITPSYAGYFAQLPVTMPVGHYPPHVRKMIPVWKQALGAAEEVLRPGKKVSDIYRAIIQTVRDGGYKAPWRPGHAIGLDLIDFWSVTESNDAVLEPGMTLAIHPNVLLEPELEGKGLGMGYTYLITTKGNERLSKVEVVD